MAERASEDEELPPLPVCVYDTNLFLQAALNPTGPAAQCFALLETSRVVLYLSPRLRSEIEDVLYRPAIRDKYPRLTNERVTALLARLDTFSEMIPNAPIYYLLPRDRKDEPILNLAIHVNAQYLVSRDRELLDLNTHADFKKTYPSLEILDPVIFCTVINP